MRSRCYVISIMLIALFWTPFVYAQEEQWLQYRHSREAQEIVRQIGSQTPELIKSRPDGVDLPELADKEPIFCQMAHSHG